ncbi:prepilin peptidase [Candidatus Poribacteria bacterium]|nr:prepilin peptidase [Candidatus Poribacteria bacterium]
MSYEVIPTALVIIFCLYATYTDIKRRRISNILTYGLIYASVVYQITLIVFGELTFRQLIYNIFGTFAATWLLYWYDVLGPGDAKLFCGISLILLPLIFQSPSSILPLFVLCTNFFVPYFIIVGIYLILRADRKIRKNAFIGSLRWQGLKQILLSLITFLALGHILSFVMVEISRLTGFIFGVLPHLVITVLAYGTIQSRIKGRRRGIYVLYAIWLVGVLILPIMRMPMDAFVKMFLRLSILMVYYGIFRGFLLSLQTRMVERAVDIDQLQEGMVSAEQVIEVEDQNGENEQVRYRKVSGSEIKRFNPNAIITPKLSGLSAQEIRVLKGLKRDGHFHRFNDQLLIQTTIPFAPALLSGVILTILFKGPFYQGFFWLFRL